MSLPRFFLDEQVLAGEGEGPFALRLSDDDARHARVLRLSPGEHIAVVDAESDYFECEVSSFDGPLVVTISSREGACEPPFEITLFQGLAKGDKVEDVVRHATEVGAGAFVPFSSSRAVAKLQGEKAERKRQRWQAVAKSAAMQSGRRAVPEVLPVASFKGACEALAAYDCVIVFWEQCEASRTLREALSCVRGLDAPRVAVVVGPEGGLSEEEVGLLLASNPCARLATLGPTILRTETAGVVGCALVSYELGGMGAQAAGCAEGAA